MNADIDLKEQKVLQHKTKAAAATTCVHVAACHCHDSDVSKTIARFKSNQILQSPTQQFLGLIISPFFSTENNLERANEGKYLWCERAQRSGLYCRAIVPGKQTN